MREIKFRAWDTQAKCMLGGGGMQLNATTGVLVHLPSVVVMQYTGLHDKQGKEIYEGDVVRGRNGWQETVVLDNYGLMCYLRDIAGRVNVIGNIYENNELIGG